MKSKPPWMATQRRTVTLSGIAIDRAERLARVHGVSTSRAIDILVRAVPAEEVDWVFEQVIEQDAHIYARWTEAGEA